MSDDRLTQAEISFQVRNDDDTREVLEAGGELSIDVDGGDIVRALNDNDGLVLSFILDMLAEAGSTELLVDLRSRIDDQLHPVG